MGYGLPVQFYPRQKTIRRPLDAATKSVPMYTSPSQRRSVMTTGFIPPHGGYKDLLSYRKSLIIFQATGLFCQRF
jgi:hypothetical protein